MIPPTILPQAVQECATRFKGLLEPRIFYSDPRVGGALAKHTKSILVNDLNHTAQKGGIKNWISRMVSGRKSVEVRTSMFLGWIPA